MLILRPLTCLDLGGESVFLGGFLCPAEAGQCVSQLEMRRSKVRIQRDGMP